MRNRKLLITFSVIFLSTLALSSRAQVVTGNGFIKGTYVEAGIRPNGAFGSSVSAPSDFTSATSSHYGGRVGFIADVGKDGWTTGTPHYIGDFFVPGTPYEAFSVKMNGSLYENSGTDVTQIPGSVTGFNSDGTTSTIEWLGTVNNLEVRQETSVSKNSSFILIRVYLKNTGSSTINNIFYTRSVDPDNEVDEGGSFDTNNKIESQNPNSTSTALVSGTGKTYSSYLGLGSRDCRARVAIMRSFSSNGEEIYNGSGTSIALSTQGATNGADNAIAVAFKIGNLAPGESTAIAMAYVLNAADLPPAMDQTDPLFNVKADSYASGSLVNVCSGSAAELNIVNGDGYSWTWSPTTGLDQTTGRTVHANLTGDITYTATGINTCGTSRTISLNLHPVITPAPADAGTITGVSTVYKGWNVSFSVPAIENATSYNWTIPAGASFVSGYGTNSVVIKFGSTASSGEVSVFGENSCGAGEPSTMNVTLSGASSPVSLSSTNDGVAAGAVFASPTIVDDQVKITGTEPITNTRVYIDNGFQSGDELAYDGTLPEGVTMSYTAATGALAFTGTASPAEWQTIFRNVTFKTTSANTANRSIKFVLGDMVSLSIAGKSHYYEYIRPGASPGWADASAAAAGRVFFGMAGYLATITSAAENDFIKAKLISDGWVGGSDDYQQINAAKGTTYATQSETEGKWFWVNGPESGTAISTGNGTPAAVSGAFMKWATGEPNNSSGENFMQLYSSRNGEWNDLSGVAGAVPGYVVEYGGYTTDPTLSIEYSRTLKSKPAPPVITSISDDTGPDANDRITSDKTIKFNGTAIANATVKISRAGTGVIGTVTANAEGEWSYDYTGTTLGEGTHNFTTTATVGGIVSNESEAIAVKIDLSAPSKPSKPAFVTGTGNRTSESKPPFKGTAEANSTVTIYIDGTAAGTTTADGDGNWTFIPSTPFSEGEHVIKVTAADGAGNTSANSDEFTFVVDHTAPVTPAAPVMTDDDGEITNNNKPTIKGATEDNAVVTIYNGSDSVTTITADADGKWSYTFTDALGDDQYQLTTTSTDATGNVSASSAALVITIDTEKPSAPAAAILETANSNGYVKTNTPEISGIAEPNATIDIYDGATKIATVTADADGKWSYTFSPVLADGNHSITTTATDAAGNVSDKSDALIIKVDTQKPEAPAAATFESDNNDGNVKTNTPAISGIAEPYATIDIYDGATKIATVTADADGKWSYTFSPALADGNHSISTTATDAAGNVSAAGDVLTIKVDTQKPARPASALEGGNKGNINTSAPTIGGTGEPGSTITVYNNGVPVGTTIVGEDGKWSYTFNPELEDGTYSIPTTSTDVAGNVSEGGDPVTIAVDTHKPVAPSTPRMESENNDGHVKTNKPTLSGNTEPGSIITVYDNGVPVATVAADENGSWTYTFDPALSDGEHTIHTTITDLAGNISVPGETYLAMVDTGTPTVEIKTETEKAAMPFTITIRFSEPVTGFGITGLIAANAKLSNFAMVSATEYTVLVSPVYDNNTVSVQVMQNAGFDASGNGNKLSNKLVLETESAGVVAQVYPNPASTTLNVVFKGVTPTSGRVMLVKMSGQRVYDEVVNFSNRTLSIDVSRYPSGHYMLLVKTNDYISRTNVLIVR